GTPGDVSLGAPRSRSRCLSKAMAQGSRPRRSGAFSDAVVDTGASVAEPVHPVAVQGGVARTGSPPFPVKAWVQSKRRRAFEHGGDGPCQWMSEDGEGLPLTGLCLEAGEACRCSGLGTEASNGRCGKRPCQRRMAHVVAGGPGACARRC